MTRLLLLGGGHAHALVLRSFRKFVSKNLDVVLVSAGPRHTYSGMVPGVIAGYYAAGDAQIDLARLARDAGAAFVQGRIERIDPAEKRVVLANGNVLSYDVASLNLGSMPAGLNENAISVKPFEDFFARWRAILEHGPAAPRIAVVGGGAGGVEVAMAMKSVLDRRGGGSVEIFTDHFAFPPALAARIRHALARLSIPLHVGEAAGPAFDATYWITGAAALPLLRESGLKTDARGYVLVDASLRSISHPDVFAAGDTASLQGAALPKSGVYAVRQAPVLAENLKRVVRGMAMLDYTPQPASLALISCGAKYAIASRGGWNSEGRWAWRWKDWLDRRWVAKFSRAGI
ncbi:MAG: FAD-dependent oxidoreductase [Betaproteobacteria bacterium]